MPNISFAENLEDINLYETGKYLELPEKDANKLMDTLRQVFTTEGIFLWSSGDATEEKIAVAVTLLKVVGMQALSYLLVDTPIEITKGIIKAAIEISKIVLMRDISDVLDKFEKETVQRAIAYGMDFLIGKELRVTPGAIKFKYYSYKGEEKEIILQYVMIYKPDRNNKGAEVEIRFYMPNSIEAPDAKKYNKGMTSLPVPDLKTDLPPFIVEIKGIVKKDEFDNYQWVDEEGKISHPSVNIDFSGPVPDLGIRPLSAWEKYVLKPIESKIKEVEIIITKAIGKSPNLTEIWEKIKSTFSKINPFLPAALVENPVGGAGESSADQEKPEFLTVKETVEGLISEVNSISEKKEGVEPSPEPTPSLVGGPEVSLEELQEMLDDIAERIDVLSQEVVKLPGAESKSETDGLEAEEIVKETEKTEEQEEEKELAEEGEQKDETPVILCEKIGGPVRNKVIFNEIAWMGTSNSVNDEWIELKNISGASVNLAGWQLLDKENQIRIIFEQQTIPSNGAFLLERTDDDSAPQVAADLIYTGILNNENEALYLFDGSCQSQDGVLASPDWPAGDNVSKRTMERKFDLTWQTSANPDGTPRRENSSGYTGVVSSGGGGGGGSSSSPSSQSTTTEATLCSASNTSPTYSPVIFNEIAWMGSASSSADEWIELKNISTSTVPLQNWQLIGTETENSENRVKLFFEENDSISVGSQSLLERSDDETVPGIPADKIFTGSINDSDFILRLFDQNCALIDEVQATSTWPAGQKTPDRRTLERANNLSWYTSYASSSINGLFGTPKAENSQTEENPPAENQPPTALFTFTPENPITNQEIIFDASFSTDSDGTITSYIWDFGDSQATTTNQATTTRSYSASGVDYMVSLWVVDDEGVISSLATTTITVTTPEIPTLEVVINEIAWMGTSATNSADEWIELYNNAASPIDLVGWILNWSHGTTTHTILFSTSTGAAITTIPTYGFYLIERSDDDQAVDIPADWKGSFGYGLNNDGEKLELRNASDTLIDLVDCSSGWFAGTTSSAYISMERINSNALGAGPTNWANNNLITRNGVGAAGNNINGTPKNQNSVSKAETQVSALPFDEFDQLTLTFLGNPYIIQNSLIIPENKQLNIEPGVTLRFFMPTVYGPNDGSYLKVQGALKAVGEAGKEIIFTSTRDLWPGIIFEAATPETEISSQLEYVRVEKARSWDYAIHYAVKVYQKAILIKNSTFQPYSNFRGLYLINSSSTIENTTFANFNGPWHYSSGEYPSALFVEGGSPVIRNNTFSQNYYGITFNTTETCLRNPDFKISANTFTQNHIPIFLTNQGFPCFENNNVLDYEKDSLDNVFDGILFAGVSILQDTIWQTDLPLIIEKGFPVENATLTVSSGTEIKFKYTNDARTRGYLRIDRGGKLIARGREDSFIVFTSAKENPGAGDWHAVWFQEGSFGELEYVKIKYGGFGSGIFRNNCFIINSPDVIFDPANVNTESCSPYE